MTEPTPEDLAFAADLDRLRAAVGADRLEEAQRRGVGDDMLEQALLVHRRDASVVFWSRPAEPNWRSDDE
jgi:hypothetical protein